MRHPLPQSAQVLPDEPVLGLDPGFWKRFAGEVWHQKPFVLQSPFAQGFPTESELFEGVLKASHGLRTGDPSAERTLRLLLEHDNAGGSARSRFFASTVMQPIPFLPVERDGSFDGWIARLQDILPGMRFGLVFNQCHRLVWNHWLQLKALIDGLVPVVGMPLGEADTATFIGNYRYTPFGIHKDNLHVFNLVVRGRKTFSLWPLEEFVSRPEVPKSPELGDNLNVGLALSPEEEAEALERGERLIGAPGDVLYWPPSWWHIATPSDGLTINISLGLAFRAPMSLSSTKLPGELPGRLVARDVPGARGPHWQPPPAVRRALPARPAGGALRDARQAALEGWLRFLTARSFDAPPPVSEEGPLKDADVVRIHPSRPVVTADPGGGRLLLSCNGHSRALKVPAPVRRRLGRLLESLNQGAPLSVQAIESKLFEGRPLQGFRRPALRELLNELARWRALLRA